MRSSRTFLASLVTASASDQAVQPMLIFFSCAVAGAIAEPIRTAVVRAAAAMRNVRDAKPIVQSSMLLFFGQFLFLTGSPQRAGTGKIRCRKAETFDGERLGTALRW